MSNQVDLDFSKLASLIGEKSRAIMLWNLLDGRAYTATELAVSADISRQACSNHLQKLIEANLLQVVKSGRHKYYRFANDKVAQIIENLASLIHVDSKSFQKTKQEQVGIKYARSCYDHLAGTLACNLTDVMLKKKIIVYSDKTFNITDHGVEWFYKIGINVLKLNELKRKLAFPCLDWSERKNHIGGSLGAAILNLFIQKDWVIKSKNSREIILTGIGELELSKILKK